jgi:hypothetical protein
VALLAPTYAQPNNKESQPIFAALSTTLVGAGAKITTPWQQHLPKPMVDGAFLNQKTAQPMGTVKMILTQNVEANHHAKTIAFDLYKLIL